MTDLVPDDPRAAVFDAYCRLFETLRPDALDGLRALCTDDVRFADPFNETAGIDRFVALFGHMFRTVGQPRFVVTGAALGAEAGYVRWRFTGTMRGRPIAVEGMSEVLFDPVSGRVSAHVDHWDAAAQVYARLPMVGAVIRALRRLFSAGV